MTVKPGNATDHRAALALEIARRLVQSWDTHLAGRTDGFQVVIHVQPGQTQAKIQWPPPPADEVKLNK